MELFSQRTAFSVSAFGLVILFSSHKNRSWNEFLSAEYQLGLILNRTLPESNSESFQCLEVKIHSKKSPRCRG